MSGHPCDRCGELIGYVVCDACNALMKAERPTRTEKPCRSGSNVDELRELDRLAGIEKPLTELRSAIAYLRSLIAQQAEASK